MLEGKCRIIHSEQGYVSKRNYGVHKRTMLDNVPRKETHTKIKANYLTRKQLMTPDTFNAADQIHACSNVSPSRKMKER